MKTACSTTSDSLSVVVRRPLLLVGFLLGCGLVALVSAGSAHADEQDRPTPSSQTRDEPASGGGLLGGLLEPVAPAVWWVSGVTDPVLSGVSQGLAPAVTPVVGAVEPVTTPLLTPVTEPLSPVLEVLAPVTEPLSGSAEPVLTPVARGLGIQPEALGVDPTRAVPMAPAPVRIVLDVDRFGVGVTVPAGTSPPMTSPTGAPVPVDVTGPLRTAVNTGSPPSEVRTSGTAAESRWHGRPGHGPVSPRLDLAVLAGAAGTASSGGNAGGSPAQADLPGYQGLGPGDSGRVIPAQRWLVRPWCYVFGRHHPS